MVSARANKSAGAMCAWETAGTANSMYPDRYRYKTPCAPKRARRAKYPRYHLHSRGTFPTPCLSAVTRGTRRRLLFRLKDGVPRRSSKEKGNFGNRPRLSACGRRSLFRREPDFPLFHRFFACIISFPEKKVNRFCGPSVFSPFPPPARFPFSCAHTRRTIPPRTCSRRFL